jgi:hypothetical protein
LGGNPDRDSIGFVAFTAVSGREKSDSGCKFGGDIEGGDAVVT